MATKKTTDAAPSAATVTYRDKTHTSRTLILGSRQLKVVAARLEVSQDDAEALAYLDGRDDVERVPGE